MLSKFSRYRIRFDGILHICVLDICSTQITFLDSRRPEAGAQVTTFVDDGHGRYRIINEAERFRIGAKNLLVLFLYDELVDLTFLLETPELEYPTDLWPVMVMGFELWSSHGSRGSSIRRGSRFLRCDSSWFEAYAVVPQSRPHCCF